MRRSIEQLAILEILKRHLPESTDADMVMLEISDMLSHGCEVFDNCFVERKTMFERAIKNLNNELVLCENLDIKVNFESTRAIDRLLLEQKIPSTLPRLKLTKFWKEF